MTRTALIASLVLVACLVASAVGWGRNERLVGELRVLERQAVARGDSLEVVVDSLAKRQAAQTATATTVRQVWNVAREQHWLRVADSLRALGQVPPETIAIPAAVLVLADSTITSCFAALTTCEASQATLRALAANWQARYELSERGKPTWGDKVRVRVTYFGGGALVGLVAGLVLAR